MKYLVALGRLFFSFIFILSSFHHFSTASIGYAQNQGVPLASIAVPASGIIALLGGLSILLGYKGKIGGWLIVIFLVPVTLMMHNFWSVVDPMQRQLQQVMFLKNLSMLGGAMLIAYFGSGPLSIDGNKKSKT